MSSNVVMEARQRVENYRKALRFLEGLQNFTYEDYVNSVRMAGIEMAESEMRQQWNMAKMTLPGTESLRQTQIEVLKEGIRVFGEVVQRLGGSKSADNTSTSVPTAGAQVIDRAKERIAKLVDVDDKTFEERVLKARLPVMVDFWAPWCGPCRMVAPLVEELADEYDGKVDFVKLNVDECAVTANKYGVHSIPTLLIFKEGKPMEQIIGFRPKRDLKRSLDKVLK